MQFMLLQYTEENKMCALPREVGQQLHGAYTAYTAALKEAGAYVANHGLKMTNAATTVRLREGQAQVQNGPFAETREQFAGYYLIDVADLDAALQWARRHPAAPYGTVEVRPVWG